MQVKTKKLGRPVNSEVDMRLQLIKHARQLFLTMPYDKVSIRLVTRKAGASSALIRYYFGDKERLFESTVMSIAEPIFDEVRKSSKCNSYEQFITLATSLFQQIKNTPQLPAFLSNIMQLPPQDFKRVIVEQAFIDLSIELYDEVFSQLSCAGLLRKDMDAKLCRFSWVNFIFFPFIVPRERYGLQDIEMEGQFLDKIFQHNLQLMTHGFILPK